MSLIDTAPDLDTCLEDKSGHSLERNSSVWGLGGAWLSAEKWAWGTPSSLQFLVLGLALGFFWVGYGAVQRQQNIKEPSWNHSSLQALRYPPPLRLPSEHCLSHRACVRASPLASCSHKPMPIELCWNSVP